MLLMLISVYGVSFKQVCLHRPVFKDVQILHLNVHVYQQWCFLQIPYMYLSSNQFQCQPKQVASSVPALLTTDGTLNVQHSNILLSNCIVFEYSYFNTQNCVLHTCFLFFLHHFKKQFDG